MRRVLRASDAEALGQFALGELVARFQLAAHNCSRMWSQYGLEATLRTGWKSDSLVMKDPFEGSVVLYIHWLNEKDDCHGLDLHPEQRAFCDEVRTFIREKPPSEIRANACAPPSAAQAGHSVAWQRILNERWAALHWPIRYGGADLGPMGTPDPASTKPYRAPPLLLQMFNRRYARPGADEVRHACTVRPLPAAPSRILGTSGSARLRSPARP